MRCSGFRFGGAEGETVTLTRANITEFASNVEKSGAAHRLFTYGHIQGLQKSVRRSSDEASLRTNVWTLGWQRLADLRNSQRRPWCGKIDVTARYSALTVIALL